MVICVSESLDVNWQAIVMSVTVSVRLCMCQRVWTFTSLTDERCIGECVVIHVLVSVGEDLQAVDVSVSVFTFVLVSVVSIDRPVIDEWVIQCVVMRVSESVDSD